MKEKKAAAAFNATTETTEGFSEQKADDSERKRPRGRPVSTNPASVVLPPIRVTPDQAIRYRAAAKRAERSLSAWIKWLADHNA